MAATYLQATMPAVGVGRAIREHRIRLHLSHGDLARLSGLDRSLISRLESGGRWASIETLQLIADALNLGEIDRMQLLSAGGYVEYPLSPAICMMILREHELLQGLEAAQRLFDAD